MDCNSTETIQSQRSGSPQVEVDDSLHKTLKKIIWKDFDEGIRDKYAEGTVHACHFETILWSWCISSPNFPNFLYVKLPNEIHGYAWSGDSIRIYYTKCLTGNNRVLFGHSRSKTLPRVQNRGASTRCLFASACI